MQVPSKAVARQPRVEFIDSQSEQPAAVSHVKETISGGGADVARPRRNPPRRSIPDPNWLIVAA
eukprot:7441252-Pyramimonas_sp.AAC.1